MFSRKVWASITAHARTEKILKEWSNARNKTEHRRKQKNVESLNICIVKSLIRIKLHSIQCVPKVYVTLLIYDILYLNNYSDYIKMQLIFSENLKFQISVQEM